MPTDSDQASCGVAGAMSKAERVPPICSTYARVPDRVGESGCVENRWDHSRAPVGDTSKRVLPEPGQSMSPDGSTSGVVERSVSPLSAMPPLNVHSFAPVAGSRA